MIRDIDSSLLSGWSTTLVFLFLATPLFRAVYYLYFHPLSKIPGSPFWAASRLPFVRALLQGTIVHDFENLHRVHGPIIRIAPDEVTFAAEDAWDDILQLKPGHLPFLKDPTWWGAQPNQPESLLSAIHPDNHARFRKSLVPGFTSRALKAQEPILHQYAALLVDRLRELVSKEDEGVAVDLVPWFNFFTFDIFGDLGFGESFNCLQDSRYHPWISLLFNSVKAASYIAAVRFYPLVDWVLMRCIPPSLKKMQRDHYQQIADKVRRRLNYEMERPDIMSHVIKASETKGLTADEMNTTFMILTTAGSETTATALAGTTNYLVQNSSKLASLTREIREAFQTENDFTLDRLRNLPYLNAVIQEGLRLCPPIPWVLPRLVPPGGARICDQWFPEGTRVSIQAYTMNRDPENFHLPTTFSPERWLEEARTDVNSPFFDDRRQVLQPFSVGPRSCMGQHLAWAEMRLALAKIVWEFDLREEDDGDRVKWEDLRTFLLVEKKPIRVRIKKRDTTA